MTKTKKLVGLLSVITTLGVLLTANHAIAAVGADVGPDCTEILQPHSFGGNTNPPGNLNQYVDESFTESECMSHAPYPNAHNPITPQQEQNEYVLPNAALNNDVHLPWTGHTHTYVNNSVEDNIGDPDDGFLYGAYMAAFEITVENDAVQNTNTASMQCPVFELQAEGSPVYNAFRNCEDGAHDPNIWGGVTLERKSIGNTIVLRYNFGTDDGTGKPWNVGKNPTYDTGDNPEVFLIDTSLEENRSFSMPNLDLVSKNNAGNIWTATTTSRALVRDQVLDKANVDNYRSGNCANGGWCILEPTDTSIYPGNLDIESVESNGFQYDYYWVKVGTVTTVWKKHEQQVQLPVCESLDVEVRQGGVAYTVNNAGDLIPDQAGAELQENQAMEIEITNVEYSDPNSPTLPVLSYRWTGLKNVTTIVNGTPITTPLPYGNFHDNFFNPNPLPITNGSTYVDNDESKDDGNPSTGANSDMNNALIYTGGPRGTVVRVFAYDHSIEAEQFQCSKEFTIPGRPTLEEPPKSCVNLHMERGSNKLNNTYTIDPGDEITGLNVDVETDPLNYKNDIEYHWTVEGQGQLTKDITTGENEKTILVGATDGTVLRVQAVDPNDPDAIPEGDCGDFIEIKHTPSKSCLGMEIVRNGVNVPEQLSGSDPTDNLTLAVATTPGNYRDDLIYRWEKTNGPGTLSANITNDKDIPVTLTDGGDGTFVRVFAEDPNDPDAELDDCDDFFQITDLAQEQVCTSLEIWRGSAPMGDSIFAGVPTDNLYVKVDGFPQSYIDGLSYSWTIENPPGSVEPETTNNPGNTVNLTGGADGTVLRVESSDGACFDELRIIDTPVEKVCNSLEMVRNGQQLPGLLPFESPTDNITLEVTGTPQSYLDSLTYTWTVIGQGQLSQTQTGSPDTPVTLTGGGEGTKVEVVSSDPNCRDEFEMEGPPACIDMEIVRNGVPVAPILSASDPTDNMTISITTDPAGYSDNLEFIWSHSGPGQLNESVTDADTPVTLTGGADGTFVNVVAQSKLDPTLLIPGCFDEFRIEDEPVLNACLDLQVLQDGIPLGDSISEGQATDNLTVDVEALPADFVDDLMFIWFVTEGEGDLSANRTDNPDDPVSLTNKSGGTKVRVDARLANDPESSFPDCLDEFVVETPPPTLDCVDLQIVRDDSLVAEVLSPTDPTDNLRLGVVTTPDSYKNDLFFDWTVVSGPGQFDASTTDDPNTLVSLTGAGAGTEVEVSARANNDPDSVDPDCVDTFVIEETTPPLKACLDLTLLRDGVEVNDGEVIDENPINNLNVTVNTEPAEYVSSLDFEWFVEGDGTLEKDITKIPRGRNAVHNPSDGTTIGVIAIDNTDPDNIIRYDQCRDLFTMVEQEVTKECVSLTVTSSNGNPLEKNEATLLTADGLYNDGSQVEEVSWSAGSGQFAIESTGNPLCLAVSPQQANPLVAPLGCAVHYSGGDAGDKIIATGSAPGDQCSDEIEIVETPPEPAVCTDLILEPSELNDADETNLTATVLFDNPDGLELAGKIVWEDSGEFNGENPLIENWETTGEEIKFTVNFQHDGDFDQHAEVYITDAENFTNEEACRAEIEGPDKQCYDIDVEQRDDELCIDFIDGSYEGDFIWEVFIDGGVDEFTTEFNDHCIPLPPPDTRWRVYAEDDPDNRNCQDEDHTQPLPPEEPKIEKLVKRGHLSSDGYRYTNVLTLPLTADNIPVTYKIEVTPGSPNTTVYLTDSISRTGTIPGLFLPLINGNPGGLIVYGPATAIRVDEIGHGRIPQCIGNDPTAWQHCYTGSIVETNSQFPGLVLHKVDNPVTITYLATVNPELDTQICSENEICQEVFENEAVIDEFFVYNNDGEVIMDYTDIRTDIRDRELRKIRSDLIRIQLFCQYILTRAAGDIFLESDITSGIDIRQCSEIETATGPIFRPPEEPEEPTLPKTGEGYSIVSINHEICSAGQAGSIDQDLFGDLYGSDVAKNLSSQICEVKLQTGSAWRSDVITNNIEENVIRISRWGEDISDPNPSHNGSGVVISAQTITENEVYHVSGDAEINEQITLNDGVGAHTLIVEDGDLYINEDILYGTCTKPFCDVRDIASLAIIVLDGSVYVSPEVETLSAVFFVQQGETPNTGRLISGTGPDDANQPSEVRLDIFGSVYGDIEPLFAQRFLSGDPSLDLGGIVIRFDQRINLNTPPGLRDVLNLSQTEVVR